MSDTFTFTFNETTSFSWTLNKEPYAIDFTKTKQLVVQWEKEGDWEIITDNDDEEFIEDYSPPEVSYTELYGNRNDECGEEIGGQKSEPYAWVVEGAFD